MVSLWYNSQLIATNCEKGEIMKFEAVIFDLDGTLLDSLIGIVDAMNALLRRLGYPTHGPDAYKYFVGEGIRELVVRALPKDKVDEHDIDGLVAEYRAIYDTTWPEKSPPYEGIPELLDTLSRKNIKMGILSNKSDDFTKRMTAALLPNWEFEAVFGKRSDIPRKPDPAAALEIADIMGIPPKNIIFMGDSGVDMQTAVRAGMLPVGVLWGFREKEELLTNGAKHVIHHPTAQTFFD
jgi:phosphoglycolate phosphatase